MNTRRRFLFALAASPIAWARAQAAKPGGKPARVGTLIFGMPSSDYSAKPFVDALRELGWTEGRNGIYDSVHAEPSRKHARAVAKELVARRPDLVWVRGNAAALAVFENTRTIPIVFAGVANPVENGLVQSLARPGGNVTGVANIGWELGGRRMQLLKEILPGIGRVGVLMGPDPRGGSAEELKLIEQAAGRGINAISAIVKGNALDPAFALLAEKRVEAVLTCHITTFIRERKRVLEWAATEKIPVIAHRSELADDGALISYSANLLDQFRRSAQLADRVLKGAKPADIPVEQPSKFELVVNLKTAKALGITIPQAVLLQASRVIE